MGSCELGARWRSRRSGDCLSILVLLEPLRRVLLLLGLARLAKWRLRDYSRSRTRAVAQRRASCRNDERGTRSEMLKGDDLADPVLPFLLSSPFTCTLSLFFELLLSFLSLLHLSPLHLPANNLPLSLEQRRSPPAASHALHNVGCLASCSSITLTRHSSSQVFRVTPHLSPPYSGTSPGETLLSLSHSPPLHLGQPWPR